jgi:putative transcription factor
MADQDWTPVNFTKTAAQKTKGMSSAHAINSMRSMGAVTTEKKMASGENKSAQSSGGPGMQKLEDSSDVFKHASVSQELSKAITQARVAKKMSQKELATAINELPGVIQQYEAGKAIPNPQIINKLDKALGIHLPRSKKK